jgi:hypothetical protein
MLESPRLTLYSLIKLGSRDVAQVNQEIRAEVSTHEFCHILKLSP